MRYWNATVLRATALPTPSAWVHGAWSVIQRQAVGLRVAFWSSADAIVEVTSAEELVELIEVQREEGNIEGMSFSKYEGVVLLDTEVRRTRTPLKRVDITAWAVDEDLPWARHELQVEVRRDRMRQEMGEAGSESGAAAVLLRAVALHVDADAAFLSTTERGTKELFMSNHASWEGIPTVGWVTYLHPREYPEVADAVELPYARMETNGAVWVEVPERPWDQDNERVVKSYHEVRKALEDRNVVIHPLSVRRIWGSGKPDVLEEEDD